MPAHTALAGDIIAFTDARIELARTFTRAADGFVDDHALGRSHAADPGGSHPLPALPFSVSLEIVAEAAGLLGGGRVTEIRDARGARWLAVDRGRLDVVVAAERRDAGVRVAVTSRSEGRTAFSADAFTAPPADPVLEIAADPGAAAPRLWDAARFYDGYAFHRGAFRGIERVTSVGRDTIEASLRIAEMPGVPLDRLVMDPAMLDCAGQLVAFWMLEQERRKTAFGIFPFLARRVVVHAPPAPPGSIVECRGRISRQSLVTNADVLFAFEGRPLVSLHGFLQHVVEFPDWFARRVFSGDPAAMPAALPPENRALFATMQGIWGRALAHLTLAPEQLDAWYAAPEAARIDRLFERI